MPQRLDTRRPRFRDGLCRLAGVEARVGGRCRSGRSENHRRCRCRWRQGAYRLFEKFDRVDLAEVGLEVSAEEIAAAEQAAAPEALAALRLAHERIISFHERQRPSDVIFTDPLGVELGWRWSAIEAVGLYVPGGTASYPSSVLMNACRRKSPVSRGWLWSCRHQMA